MVILSIFLCKCTFREISMIIIVIFQQNKPISLILKIEIRKFKNPKFVNRMFIIYKNGNKTCIQPILKSNYTSFMFNNNFCEMNIKKVTHRGAWGKGGIVLISSWNCNFQVITWISKYITWISKQ